jgi:hypothetical protein
MTLHFNVQGYASFGGYAVFHSGACSPWWRRSHFHTPLYIYH